MKATIMEKVGGWSFILGFLVAVVVGAINITTPGVVTLLLVLGTVVGLLNVTDREIVPFLVACIALIITGSVASVVPIEAVSRVLVNVVVFVVPAAVIASLKAIVALAAH